MTPAARIASFGSAGLCIICGAICAAVIGGEAGQLLGMILIGLGLILATAFVFMEVGLSEDRERALEERARRERAQGPGHPSELRNHRPTRLERSRGHRRRLS